MLDRREFLLGVGGLSVALAARALHAQQGTAPDMDASAYRRVHRAPKPGAAPVLSVEQRDLLEKELKCQCPCILDVYTCRTTDFSCGISPAMHRDVIALVEGGYTADEIKAAFVETYGEVALTAPVKQGFNWAGYFAPAVVMATGALLLTLMLRRWSLRAAASAPPARASAPAAPVATDDEMARLARALREEE